MKRKLPLIYNLFFVLLCIVLFSSFSGTPPTGLTGAPGDGTCNNCHFGGTQTGTVDVTGIVDVDNPIIANKTYNVVVTITLMAGVSTRAGFQFVALDGNAGGSPSTGTFSNLGTNVGTATSGSRTYAQHSGGENLYSGSTVTYTFDWTAPASSTNNISFYVTGNISDLGGTGGDLIVFDSDQNIPLPVELVEFKAKDLGNGQVELNWLTASEENSDYFDVQRSDNGKDYADIGRLLAAGHTSDFQEYQFIDTDPIVNRNSFYRLQQVDLDGQISYSHSEVIQTMNYKGHHLNVFPNPARNNECLFIDYMSDESHPNAIVRIYDLFGRSVFEDPQMYAGIREGFNKFVFDIKDLATGQYFLSIKDGNRLLESKSFIVGY